MLIPTNSNSNPARVDFSRLSTVVANSAVNQKAFLVLAPANDVTSLENYIATLVGTDSYVEKTSRAEVRRLWKTFEIHANGNPGYIRMYWLTPRNNPATGTAGAISSGASSISTLITNDDTLYAEGGSLATNLHNTLYDVPSVVRDYKILKCTKWKKLSPVNNKPITFRQIARYPKIFDAGGDTFSTKWKYLPKTVIPIIEMKGYGGMDGSGVVNPGYTYPNTNNTLTQYTITEPTTGGQFSRDANGATHFNVSAFDIVVRIINGCDLALLNDEVREINTHTDTAPTGVAPIYIAPRIEAYLGSSA